MRRGEGVSVCGDGARFWKGMYSSTRPCGVSRAGRCALPCAGPTAADKGVSCDWAARRGPESHGS